VLRRVLVANRGEIALRIIRTLDRLGVESVAVFSDADRGAPHVDAATMARRVGPAPARDSYLDAEVLLAVAATTGCDAVHPGYGFLSEHDSFASAVEAAGMAWIGPTPAQLHLFGDKQRARDAAVAAGVPLLAGTGPLATVDAALAAADAIGYPVILKSTAGGGGIGMHVCAGPADLAQGFDGVVRTAVAAFGVGTVFLERFVAAARHVEVQVFGDGTGGVVVLGERDCSLQRRNQKVMEEAPAPGRSDDERAALAEAARALAASVDYRSAGTVEFLVDASTGAASFLEVNARLQVEHPVTEAVYGIDLVEWMVRLAGGDATPVAAALAVPPVARGHAMEVRLYAEDPAHEHRPCAGLLTDVRWPSDGRVDTWVAPGTEITAAYDPLLAKVVVHGDDRHDAHARLLAALDATRLAGIETNLAHLREVVRSQPVREGRVTTATLGHLAVRTGRIEVLDPGALTTVQEHPGRLGYWHVGIPPSGPMDDLSFRLGNVVLGNDPGAAGLEATLSGPTLVADSPLTVCVTGAPSEVTVAGVPVPMWEAVEVPAGVELRVGAIGPPGLRAHVLVRGGIDVPVHLGSRATFTLGGFGGHGGRALRPGDVLRRGPDPAGPTVLLPVSAVPELGHEWELRVAEGPHADDEFLAPADVAALHETAWRVHFQSARTGVRLVGPAPTWARADGGDAGLHPSNIHDTPYSVGSVDFTGDMPILLGPDGPSLGGFVCPAVVVEADRWKLGQLRPDDVVRFVPVSPATARTLRAERDAAVAGTGAPRWRPTPEPDGAHGVLDRLAATPGRPAVTYRRSGDDALLVEYGPMVLDLALRARVHALMAWVVDQRLPGLVDVTPGIRSLQLHVDTATTTVERVHHALRAAEDELPDAEHLDVPSRIVHLPLSWDDPATRLAIDRYVKGVRDDAPWCPWNIEFIRRINGLASVDDVHRIVHDASYLVLGLGDVYLGAPVATPVDPRHRLVTTKYNPARTWTPENAVGIGGAYLCIYGMEGPGGYQFVGRTVPVWDRFGAARKGAGGAGRSGSDGGLPWLLRFFDQIRWYPVGADELLDLRADVAAGRHELRIEPTTFRLADHLAFEAREAGSIEAFRSVQRAAFAAERDAWVAAGEFDRDHGASGVAEGPRPLDDLPPGATVVRAPLTASVWHVGCAVGDAVAPGDVVVVLEAMKMETSVRVPLGGVVRAILVEPGGVVAPGDPLVVVEP
jgi:urea carboxylase